MLLSSAGMTYKLALFRQLILHLSITSAQKSINFENWSLKTVSGLGYWASRLGTTNTCCLPSLFPVLHKMTKQSYEVLIQFFPLSLQNFRKHFSSEHNCLFRLNLLLLRKTWSRETGLDSWTGWTPRAQTEFQSSKFC